MLVVLTLRLAIATLNANRPVSGNVAARLWNFYSYTVSYSGSALAFSLNQTSTGDCDLYVRWGQIPTRYLYDLRDISAATNMTLSVAQARSGTWYTGVYGYTGCACVSFPSLPPYLSVSLACAASGGVLDQILILSVSSRPPR